MTGSPEGSLASLQAGATALAALGPAARGDLARRTALAVVAAADAWVEAAVAIKRATGATAGAVAAEETATGPLATLRLLLVTARSLREIAATGLPRPAAPPRVLHRGGGDASFIGVEVLPERWLADRAMFGGHSGTVRCANPGDLASFERSWRQECRERPRQGGVAAVLGAGNVTGLAVADVVSQVFEHGRAAFVKLHPVHVGDGR